MTISNAQLREAGYYDRVPVLFRLNQRMDRLSKRGLSCADVAPAQIGSLLFKKPRIDNRVLVLMDLFLAAVERLKEIPQGRISLIGAAMYFGSGKSVGEELFLPQRARDTLASFVRPEEEESLPTAFLGIWLPHNVNSMLMALGGFAELAKVQLEGEDVAGAVASIEELTNLAKTYSGHVKRLSEFLKPREARTEALDPTVAFDQALSDLIPEAEGIKVIKEYYPKLPSIIVDKKLFSVMIREIIDNALREFEKPKTRKMLHLIVQGTKTGVRLEIWNSGSSIKDDQLTKVFKPFITTQSTDEGFGLGLAFVAKYAKIHGWQVGASNVDNGVAITIDIPVKEEA